MKRSTVLLADDHAVVIEGLRRILDCSEFEVVGIARDGRALVQAAADLKPDVIITDFAMPLLNGLDAVREICRRSRKPRKLFLTMHPEPAYAVAALAAGASGYILKSAAGDELIGALRQIMNGRTYVSSTIVKLVPRARQIRSAIKRDAIDLLTHRQREVLQLLAEGHQTKEIALVLKISRKTAEFHKYRIMDALGLRTVAALTRYALKHGIVADAPPLHHFQLDRN